MLLIMPVDYPPTLHNNPQDTEVAALNSIKGNMRNLRRKTLQALLEAPHGLTGSEICTNIDGYVNSVKPRITELSAVGHIFNTTERRKNTRGRTEIVWAITEKGKQAL